jgi:hypothetical protein
MRRVSIVQILYWLGLIFSNLKITFTKVLYSEDKNNFCKTPANTLSSNDIFIFVLGDRDILKKTA